MIHAAPQPTARERFNNLYGNLSIQRQPVVVADATAGAPEDISFATAENIGLDNSRRLGYRALSMLTIYQIRDVYVVGKRNETVELYEAPDGQLTACFGDSVRAMETVLGSGVVYGHPHRQHSIPAHSAEIAVNSALLAMEQSLSLQES